MTKPSPQSLLTQISNTHPKGSICHSWHWLSCKHRLLNKINPWHKGLPALATFMPIWPWDNFMSFRMTKTLGGVEGGDDEKLLF